MRRRLQEALGIARFDDLFIVEDVLRTPSRRGPQLRKVEPQCRGRELLEAEGRLVTARRVAC